MVKLPTINDVKVKDKRVLLRLDTDVPLHFVQGKRVVEDDFRLKVTQPTIEFLLDRGASQIIILGKLGRPKGRDKRFSLRPVAKHLEKMIGKKITLINVPEVAKVPNVPKEKIVMLENLRFDDGEEENDSEFAKKLASLGQIYINESFADSHRKHASIVALPQHLKSKFKNSVFAGLRFAAEVEHLEKVLVKSERPLVFIIGGAKSDKAAYIEKLMDIGDWVLVGGLLPRMVKSVFREDGKVCVSAAHLLPGGRDIDETSAINFAAIAANAGTIVWDGPLGMCEDKEFARGTEIVARAVARNENAFKVVGGGHTVPCLKKIGVLDKMNWVSTGGGSMLEFLVTGDLPGLKALRE
ncbi:phosphoglycerate kinase [Candidatus Microgenomates bacterium]|nr:phosphoglycerate kinase [Candidatus Microgenomates bacterium]